eukprot:3939398-Rhodomonas_salina.2
MHHRTDFLPEARPARPVLRVRHEHLRGAQTQMLLINAASHDQPVCHWRVQLDAQSLRQRRAALRGRSARNEGCSCIGSRPTQLLDFSPRSARPTGFRVENAHSRRG